VDLIVTLVPPLMLNLVPYLMIFSYTQALHPATCQPGPSGSAGQPETPSAAELRWGYNSLTGAPAQHLSAGVLPQGQPWEVSS
jgi:hypothetical protein